MHKSYIYLRFKTTQVMMAIVCILDNQVYLLTGVMIFFEYIIDNGDIEEVSLKEPLNGRKQYDLLLLDNNDNKYIKKGIKIIPEHTIKFAKKIWDLIVSNFYGMINYND